MGIKTNDQINAGNNDGTTAGSVNALKKRIQELYNVRNKGTLPATTFNSVSPGVKIGSNLYNILDGILRIHDVPNLLKQSENTNNFILANGTTSDVLTTINGWATNDPASKNSGCRGGCVGFCYSACHAACSSGCVGSSEGHGSNGGAYKGGKACSADQGGGCTGSCHGTCNWSCYDICDGCHGSCTANCQNSCSATCQSNCNNTCAGNADGEPI